MDMCPRSPCPAAARQRRRRGPGHHSQAWDQPVAGPCPRSCSACCCARSSESAAWPALALGGGTNKQAKMPLAAQGKGRRAAALKWRSPESEFEIALCSSPALRLRVEALAACARLQAAAKRRESSAGAGVHAAAGVGSADGWRGAWAAALHAAARPHASHARCDAALEQSTSLARRADHDAAQAAAVESGARGAIRHARRRLSAASERCSSTSRHRLRNRTVLDCELLAARSPTRRRARSASVGESRLFCSTARNDIRQCCNVRARSGPRTQPR
jgi:hypothetical protein